MISCWLKPNQIRSFKIKSDEKIFYVVEIKTSGSYKNSLTDYNIESSTFRIIDNPNIFESGALNQINKRKIVNEN